VSRHYSDSYTVATVCILCHDTYKYTWHCINIHTDTDTTSSRHRRVIRNLHEIVHIAVAIGVALFVTCCGATTYVVARDMRDMLVRPHATCGGTRHTMRVTHGQASHVHEPRTSPDRRETAI